MTKIIAFSGSNSSKSINERLLDATIPLITGAEVQKLKVTEFPMPIYSQDLEEQDGFPETVTELQTLFQTADGFILASPEHNGGMPAVLKNCIDWLSRVASKEQPLFQNKPVMLLSTSPGPNGGATNITQLAKLIPWWGAREVHSHSLGSFYDHMGENGLDAESVTALQAKLAAFQKDVAG